MRYFVFIALLNVIFSSISYAQAVLYTYECPLVDDVCDTADRYIHAYKFQKGELTLSEAIYDLNEDDANEFFEFDLENQTLNHMADSSTWFRSGISSPDLTKKIIIRNDFYEGFGANNKRITLHMLRDQTSGHPVNKIYDLFEWLMPNQIARHLNVTIKDGLPGDLPIVWIDNERLLTQQKNGELVIISTDSSVSHLVTIPTETLPPNVVSPELYRNAEGKFIYSISGEQYEVDIDQGTYKQKKWEALGHGFEIEIKEHPSKKRKINYLGKTIGLFRIESVLATKEYIAVLFQHENSHMDNEFDHLAVWSSHSQAWIEKEVGRSSTFIGWVDNSQAERSGKRELFFESE